MQTTLRKLPLTCPLLILLLLPALARAETAVQAWVQRYNGPGNSHDYAYALAVDASNAVLVAGSVTVGGLAYDYRTIKYSSAGVPLWTNDYHGPALYRDDSPTALAVDGSNNVIVTGYSNGGGSGRFVDYATIKYSSTGVPLWTNRYDGPTNRDDQAQAVVVDGSNCVIVTGHSESGPSDHDYVTIKYSSAGTPLWTNRYSGPGNGYDYANALAVDSSNSVIVAGASYGSGSSWDCTTLKYSSAGVPLWTNRYNGPGNSSDQALSVAVDRSDNVIVTGASARSNALPLNFDYATIKYSSTGTPLWTNRYNGPGNSDDEACVVAVDRSNNVIVTGYSIGNASSNDYATVKYSSVGVPLWTNRYNGPGNSLDRARAVALDGSNNVIVTGDSTGSAGTTDYATVKYSSAGVPLWTNRYNGPGNSSDQAVAVALDRGGNVIVTGYSTGSGSGYDFATVKYVSVVPPPVLTALRFTNGSCSVRVDDLLQACKLVIERSSNLPGWTPVFTNTTPTNVLFYTDPEASNYPTRFYRAFQFP
jgi:uncharacterized delta-60 repeat protein